MTIQSVDHSVSSNPERFVKISDREDVCTLPQGVWRPLTQNYLLQTWKGISMDKSPLEISLYPMLIYELQPKTIIELGAETGGSALWLADQLKAFDLEGKVYSVDIDLSLLDKKAKTSANVHFLEGDCHKIEEILPPELLANCEHPWLIVEDVHVNVGGLLDYFHGNGLRSGDYIIVEDTNQDLWKAWSDWDDKDFIERMGNKLNVLKSWLMKHPDEYLIDSYYQDMFGYNSSKNWNSILKKVDGVNS